MDSTLRIITTGVIAQQRNLDTIANNLANVHTPGFKRARVEFKDLPYYGPGQAEAGEGWARLVEGSEGEGVRINATQLLFGQGPLEETQNPLDLALDGPGFFAVQMPDGTTAYTRNGNFTLDQSGRIVSHDGLPLSPEIEVPTGATDVQVDSQGVVWAKVGDGEPQKVGQITIARFANPEGLAPIGHSLFVPTVASGEATSVRAGTPGQANLHSKMIEGSNVDLGDEMTRLIQAQRAYQLGLQALRVWDELASRATNVRR